MIKKTVAKDSDQLYCSVDLEFTGFDPARDQILEIGFAFFRMTEAGVEITEQWSQVFKPSIEVHPKILGLTGITQAELDAAPEFNEHREFLQEKLGGAIIVGHNPVMDVKFLEAYGLTLSGQVIDTLELVQFILPVHHSYNLENLVHYFGIKHHNAHRALGDAISTATVLENLLRVHSQFSNQLKIELQAVFQRGEFLWQELFDIELAPKDLEQNDSLANTALLGDIPAFELTEELVSIDNTPDNHDVRVVLGLKEKGMPTMVVVPDSATVMKLWKAGLVHGVFRTDDTFSKQAFNKFLKNAQTSEELRFSMKVIVWLHTNWQTEVVFDLNISFFGGQFRSFIVGGEPRVGDEVVLCADYITLQSLVGSASAVSETNALEQRELVVLDIQNFESFMSSGFGTRLSWSSTLYALKLIYNPETDFGDMKAKDAVVNALISTDLFFGLVFMLLHKTFSGSPYATIEELESNHGHVLGRLQRAAENLREKIYLVQNQTQPAGHGSDLTRVTKFLETFFESTEGRVKWINIDERNLSFADQPIEIAANVNNVLQGFNKVRFTETITQPQLLSYLVDRLGLHTEMSELDSKTLNNKLNLKLFSEKITEEQLFNEVVNSTLPLVVVFPDLLSVKDFYNSYYGKIKENAALFAQSYSGGGNKMFRNFSIRQESVLLVTADFMAKQNYKIPAQTIIFTAPPLVEAKHPYTAALLKHWVDKHQDLISTLQAAKITAVIKKVKLTNTVLVKIYNFAENQIFVDNPR